MDVYMRVSRATTVMHAQSRSSARRFDEWGEDIATRDLSTPPPLNTVVMYTALPIAAACRFGRFKQ